MAQFDGKEARFNFALEQTLLDDLRDFAKSEREDMSVVARRAIQREIDGGRTLDAALENFRAKFIASAPCGPWRQAAEEAGDYVLSADVADTLEARDGDRFIQAEGSSMVAAGIPDGAMLLVRPLSEGRRPVKREIALVQIIREHDVYESTVKRWMNSEPIRLVDGNDDEFELPADTIKVVPVGVVRGVISRL